MGGIAMAKKTKAARPKGKPDPDAMTTRALRMRQEYADWVDELARFDRSSVSALIDRALAHYGKAIGFEQEAPSR
jgi:hypothetical protein